MIVITGRSGKRMLRATIAGALFLVMNAIHHGVWQRISILYQYDMNVPAFWWVFFVALVAICWYIPYSLGRESARGEKYDKPPQKSVASGPHKGNRWLESYHINTGRES